jgi:paraquat-inducible protein B
MSTSSKPAVVGGFVLGALALAVAGILFFGGTRWFGASVRVVVFFPESVANLDVGAPVTFNGVRIGAVESVAVHVSAHNMTARIPVYLKIDTSRMIWDGRPFAPSEHPELVRAGLRAQLALVSMVTGQQRVDLLFRPNTPAQLVGASEGVLEIPAIPSDFGELRSQLTGLQLRELTDSAQGTLSAVGRLATHVDTVIDPFVERIGRTADAATHTLQTADGAVRNLQGDASVALHDLDAALVSARHQVDARGGELSHTLAAADRSMAQAEKLLQSLNGAAEPGSELRDDLQATVRDLAASASSLRDFAETIERNPNAIVMGRSSR